MSYEDKVIAVFGGIVLVLHVAVRVYIWKRSKEWPDGRKLFWHLLWWDVSLALLIGGIVVWIDFMDSWIGRVGIGIAIIGLLSKLAAYISSWSYIKRRRTLDATSGTPPLL